MEFIFLINEVVWEFINGFYLFIDSIGINVNVRYELISLEVVMKEFEKVRLRMKVYLLRIQYDVERRFDRSFILVVVGGCLGIGIRFNKT